jgi:hypothetical protein
MKKPNGLFGNININNINTIFESRGIMPLEYGFIDSDIIYVPYGITIVIITDIDMEELKVNNNGKQYIANLKKKSDYDLNGSLVQTVITPKKIMRIVKIPLVLNLENFIIQEQPPQKSTSINNKLSYNTTTNKEAITPISTKNIKVNITKGLTNFHIVSKPIKQSELTPYYRNNR